MKERILYIVFTLLITLTTSAQSRIENMLKQKRYAEVTAFANQTDKLSGKDIFHIGQAFIMQGEDQKAVEMFNKAINKGYKNGELYFAKGVAETNLELYPQSINSFRQALYYLPNRKKVLIELAGAYYKAEELDSAYSVYSKIEKNWGEYFPALIMTCQILHEQERYAKALDCYYTKLHVLKKDDYYHREALEAIMRMEWHYFERYEKAEVAIKNLMELYPENYEYSMLLMQLYNFTGRYADAALLENRVMDGYSTLKLAESYYQKGAMVVDQFDTAQYHIEAYRNFQPEKVNGCVYKIFLFNYDGTRPLGKIEALQTDSINYLSGYALDSVHPQLQIMDYETVKNTLLKALFLPDTATLDSISEY